MKHHKETVQEALEILQEHVQNEITEQSKSLQEYENSADNFMFPKLYRWWYHDEIEHDRDSIRVLRWYNDSILKFIEYVGTSDTELIDTKYVEKWVEYHAMYYSSADKYLYAEIIKDINKRKIQEKRDSISLK